MRSRIQKLGLNVIWALTEAFDIAVAGASAETAADLKRGVGLLIGHY